MSAGRIVVFVVFAGGLLGSLHYYAWTRLVRDPQLGAPWATIATWSKTVLLYALLVGAIPASFVLPRSAGTILAWAAYIWMGFAFFLVVLLATTDLGRLAAGVTRSAGEPRDRRRAASPPATRHRRGGRAGGARAPASVGSPKGSGASR